jgi:protein involved in polysaccharide export with SLBB domain
MKPCKARLFWLPTAKSPFRRPLSGTHHPGPRTPDTGLSRLTLFALLLLAGCCTNKATVEQNLVACHGPYQPGAGVVDSYVVVCPDVLDLTFDSHPESSGLHPVGIDGRLDLEPLGRPRVEGQTVKEIAIELADLAGLPLSKVSACVAEYRGRCIYLVGEVVGSERAVPYQGQETVLDLLQRTGGITPGAAPEEVYVVRTHMSDGRRPEIFHVDLESIVLRHDDSTNLRLQPFDQVHVGATRRAGLQKCVPPWLRPCYQRLCEWLPMPGAGQ